MTVGELRKVIEGVPEDADLVISVEEADVNSLDAEDYLLAEAGVFEIHEEGEPARKVLIVGEAGLLPAAPNE